VGSLDYGQTSGTVKYHNPPKYRAFKFGGQKGDKVVIDVASANGDSYAWLTNNAFKVIKSNDDSGDSLDSHIEATLPGNSNPDIITYYIIFKEYSGHDATFHVSLAKKNFCVDTQFCIQGAHWDSTQCKCVSDQQFCGGIAAIRCPAGQVCVDNPNDSCDPNNGGADCGGICVFQQTCGGIAGIQCPAGFECVDNPDDSCDPNNGGADCGGICVEAPTDGCAAVRCASGTQCMNCFGGPRCLAPGEFCAL